VNKLSTKLVLQHSPIFGSLDDGVVDALVGMSTTQNYHDGESIFREGEAGDVLIGVISGSINIHTNSRDGQLLNLNRIYPGEVIGEIAFLDGGTRTASGEATEQTQCFTIKRAPFIELMRERSELAEQLLILVCQRVRWTSDRVADFAFLTPQARLGRRLVLLAADAREVQISQAELANFLGISRQAVNGYLRDWQIRGTVELYRGRIVILDAAELLSITDP